MLLVWNSQSRGQGRTLDIEHWLTSFCGVGDSGGAGSGGCVGISVGISGGSFGVGGSRGRVGVCGVCCFGGGHVSGGNGGSGGGSWGGGGGSGGGGGGGGGANLFNQYPGTAGIQ